MSGGFPRRHPVAVAEFGLVTATEAKVQHLAETESDTGVKLRQLAVNTLFQA